MPNQDFDFSPKTYRTQTARLTNWDYSTPGYYFVTICTEDGKCWFGRVVEREMQLSEVGKVVKKYWKQIPEHFENVSLDEFEILPNHLHGIVVIEGNGDNDNFMRRDVACNVSTEEDVSKRMSRMSPKAGSLSAIIRSFKSAVSKRVHELGHANFSWQSRFYDHVIRSEKSLERVRFYIRHNVQKWELDKLNPDNT